VRKVVAHTGKLARMVPAVAERYWQRQEVIGVKTHEEQRSVLERFVLSLWTGDVSKCGPQNVRDLIDGLKLAHKTRLNVFVAISGVFESPVMGGLISPTHAVK